MIIDDLKNAIYIEKNVDPRSIVGIRMNSRMIKEIHEWTKDQIVVKDENIQCGLHGSIFGITIFLGINKNFEFLHSENESKIDLEEAFRYIYQTGRMKKNNYFSYKGEIS